MSVFTKTDTIWFNGRFVPWDDARVHVMAHGLHYGTGVFEGIRSYQTAEGPAIFRLDAHLQRFFDSAALYEMEIPYPPVELGAAAAELLRRNELGDAYMRPIAFFDAHTISLWTAGAPVAVAIVTVPMGAYLGGGREQGVRVTLTEVRRFDSAAIPARGKACGQYINSVRAVQDAKRRGFDEAILLNSKGELAEGSGENLFVVQGGSVATNDEGAEILMGITRASVLELAADLGLPTAIRPLALEDLTAADELFFTGTAAEVTPIREVDGRLVGDGRPGPVTRRLQEAFFDIVRGRRPAYRRWLTFVGGHSSLP